MIKIFGKTDRHFETNGDIVAKPTRAIVREEDNGSYYLDLEADLSYVDYLVEGNIVIANTPRGDQAFRVTNPTKTQSKISVKAPHVFYDARNYLIQDSYVDEKDCNYALDHLNSATSDITPFDTISDITTIASYRCVRTSLEEAIKTVIERWGGHLVRDNFTIGVMSNIGVDNGVTIRYRKNLKEITCEENWDAVVTRLLPVGKDGILLNELDSSADLYVYSDVQYEIPYTRSVSFEQDISEDDYKDESGNVDETAYKQALVDDLREQAEDYVQEHSVPLVNYTLNANIEKVTGIGDTVEVIDERLGISLMTNVIAYEYDCILEKYKSVEFGNFQQTLGGLISGITQNSEKIAEEKSEAVRVTLGEELESATSKIWSALGDSYVIYDGDKILVVDRLPKENAQNVIMINSGGIGFSKDGINGTFNSAWTIDGRMNMKYINVVNLTANMIKGGTLKLGSKLNESGTLEIYDEQNTLIGQMDKNGLTMFGRDGSKVVMNESEGFAGYDLTGQRIYWVRKDEFHMRKSVVTEEITLCNRMRFIPITLTGENDEIINDGIGLVSVFMEDGE